MTQKQNWMSSRLAVAVAGGIAVVAFLAGQVVEGSGIILAVAASTLWLAYSLARQRRHERGG